jgi:hypothetical protein
MSILTVGSSPGRGMRLNLPIAIVPLRRTDTGFQPPATYLGDEQMLRILGRGHSVPTVTELIFVRAQCLTILLFKHFAPCGPITGSELLNLQKSDQFPDELVKTAAAQSHYVPPRRTSNSRHKRDSVRGTIILVCTA